ncbi:hypothetical protein [Marinobacterium litorale]|uniref:hypothetical protein n=1 Tax=Marinobacterium litorale TaxID=404770 RepID=UPI000410C3D4|nr:hypothetical protein [Marinobacterium litorale]
MQVFTAIGAAITSACNVVVSVCQGTEKYASAYGRVGNIVDSTVAQTESEVLAELDIKRDQLAKQIEENRKLLTQQ